MRREGRGKGKIEEGHFFPSVRDIRVNWSLYGSSIPELERPFIRFWLGLGQNCLRSTDLSIVSFTYGNITLSPANTTLSPSLQPLWVDHSSTRQVRLQRASDTLPRRSLVCYRWSFKKPRSRLLLSCADTLRVGLGSYLSAPGAYLYGLFHSSQAHIALHRCSVLHS